LILTAQISKTGLTLFLENLAPHVMGNWREIRYSGYKIESEYQVRLQPNRESRENRERDRRCNPAFSVLREKERF
jgi:hypothetical protein